VDHRRLTAAAALLAGLAACAARPEPPGLPHDGPIVLLTLEGLRADAVGALGGPPGLTPALDGLAAEADWVGRAVAPSSWLVPSLASLFTGLRPWQHQATTPTHDRLPPTLVTLAEALARLGYRGRGYHETRLAEPGSGWGQGFSELAPLGRGHRALADLRGLGGGRDFLWLHLAMPTGPYLRRDSLADRVGPLPAGLPRRIAWIDLEPYFDPQTPLPHAERERLLALYRFNVAAADLAVGRFLAALEESGQRESALVAVVSLYGQEFGEHGQIAAGGNLGRAGVEVPLIVKLPRGSRRALALPQTERVASSRLWATLVEAAGGAPPPGVAPSLFRRPASPLISELYAAGGHNEFSLVEGDLQLRWVRRFTALDGAFYRTRLASARAPREARERREFRLLLRRIDRAFRRSPPLSGPASDVSLRLERWMGEGVQAVDDRARTAAMADRLRAAFLRFLGAERTPDEEAARGP
jgi:hypothetical protein